MEENVKKFLEAEETANNILESLKKLQAEAANYKEAKDVLETIREQLVNLINSTEEVVKGSHIIVKILKDIGGPAILNRLDRLESKTNDNSERQSKALIKLKNLVYVSIMSSLIAIGLMLVLLFR